MAQGLFSRRDKGKERREKRLSKGLCIQCGENKISKDSVSRCDDCLKLAREKYYKRKIGFKHG